MIPPTLLQWLTPTTIADMPVLEVGVKYSGLISSQSYAATCYEQLFLVVAMHANVNEV